MIKAKNEQFRYSNEPTKKEFSTFTYFMGFVRNSRNMEIVLYSILNICVIYENEN